MRIRSGNQSSCTLLVLSFILFRNVLVNLNVWQWNAITKISTNNLMNGCWKPVLMQRWWQLNYITFYFVFLCLVWSFSRCSVLLFPPLNSYRRFLIHKLCDKFPTLGSFSISEGNDRRIVIYSRTNTKCNQTASNSFNSEERWDFLFSNRFNFHWAHCLKLINFVALIYVSCFFSHPNFIVFFFCFLQLFHPS